MIAETITIGILALIIACIVLLVSSSRPTNGVDTRPVASAKDNALYFAMFMTLTVSITNFIGILFAAIDKKFPDTLQNGFNYNPYNDDVRFAIASLVVVFPLFVFFSHRIVKDIVADTSKALLAVRKNIYYLIYIVTGLVIISTLIYTIYSYLGGELTSRFMWKAIVSVIIALAVFGYTKYSLNRKFVAADKTPLLVAGAISLLVIASIVYSVSILGSPSEIRKTRFDEQRINDLQNLQNQIKSHWQQTRTLPSNLDDIKDQISGYDVPRDPKTGEEYNYKIIKDTTYVKGVGNECDPYVKPTYDNNGNKIPVTNCDIPQRVEFEICANFETERSYIGNKNSDMYRPDVITTAGGVVSSSYDKYDIDNIPYGIDNSFWDHKAEKTCFKRSIDPAKNPFWNNY